MDDKRKDLLYEIKILEEKIIYDLSNTGITKDKILSYKKKFSNLNREIEELKNGDTVNTTENLPALHHILRSKEIIGKVEEYMSSVNNLKKSSTRKDLIKLNDINLNEIETNRKNLFKNPTNEMVEVYEELVKMFLLTKEFPNIIGITSKRIKNIVNIGIGGSDLGPRMVTEAFKNNFYSTGISSFYLSNLDPSGILSLYEKIDFEETIFIVVSKSFTTLETLENMNFVVKIFLNRLMEKINQRPIAYKQVLSRIDSSGKKKEDMDAEWIRERILELHFIGITTKPKEANKKGIKKYLKFWNYVGGRYSLWSSAGLSIAISMGFENFLRLLKGAGTVDESFFREKENSFIVDLAINEIYQSEKGYNNHCIIPYDENMKMFYKYIQQLEMESNGKKGSKQMIIWGGVGTDVQHSFFQLLHQGEQKIYSEFLIPIENREYENYKKGNYFKKRKEMEKESINRSLFSTPSRYINLEKIWTGIQDNLVNAIDRKKVDLVNKEGAISNEVLYLMKESIVEELYKNLIPLSVQNTISKHVSYCSQEENGDNRLGDQKNDNAIVDIEDGSNIEGSFYEPNIIDTRTVEYFLQVAEDRCGVYGDRKYSVGDLLNSHEIGRSVEKHHKMLLSNAVAQISALNNGNTGNRYKPLNENETVNGGKPTLACLYTKLEPEILGAIIAIFEHKTFVVGKYYNINSFDQFGVALGKSIAGDIYKKMEEDKDIDVIEKLLESSKV